MAGGFFIIWATREVTIGESLSKSDHNFASSWEMDEYLCWEEQGFLSNYSTRKKEAANLVFYISH